MPLRIQVAALLTTDWLTRNLRLPEGQSFDRIILPGYCRGDVHVLTEQLGIPVSLGPSDLYDLPEFLGGKKREPADLSQYSIDIIAEINHASRLSIDQIIEMAEAYRNDGADIIDVGCDPAIDRPAWEQLAEVVRELRSRDFRVSVDSLHPDEIAAACRAGAELVLSVNSSNRQHAADWGAEVVVIPDDPSDLSTLHATVEYLEKRGVKFRLDPVIEPIGFGFSRSLGRYIDLRDRYPETDIMMGVGNLSEMTEVDSAGVNMLLAGICEELSIRSVLTTQVINWARSSVREFDIARRMVHHAIARGTVPKHLDPSLVMLRDTKIRSRTREDLNKLAEALTDKNIRLFINHETGLLHGMNRDVHAAEADPFVLFNQLGVDDPSHAFYLGYELAKAVTALTLSKNYEQDEALNWGHLTRDEVSHYENRPGSRARRKAKAEHTRQAIVEETIPGDNDGFGLDETPPEHDEEQ